MVKALAADSLFLMPESMQYKNVEINLILTPEETFIYDHLSIKEADELLDQIKFYNELTMNIKYSQFLKEKTLSRIFAPTATFH